MGFFSKKNKQKIPEKMIPIFEKMEKNLQGKKIADEALSHRSLGNFDKAHELLKRSLSEFNYIPAMTLISTTFILQKKFNEAISWIKLCLLEMKGNEDIRMELLANLGLIYFRELENFTKARDIYLEALEIKKPSQIDEKAYELMKANIYRDLAGVYYMLGEFDNSMKCCQLRLKVIPTCEITLKIKDQIEKYNKQPNSFESKSIHERKTVLLSPFMDEAFTDIFSVIGFDVIWDSKIESLKKLLLENKIDIAIEWDYGHDTIRKMMEELKLNIPILLCLNLTGKIPDDINKRGYVDYLDIPFKIDELRFKLKKYTEVSA